MSVAERLVQFGLSNLEYPIPIKDWSARAGPLPTVSYEQGEQFTVVARRFAAKSLLLDDVRLALIVFAKCPRIY